MRRIIAVIIIAFWSSLLAAAGLATSTSPSPVGLWKTIDESSGKVQALVKIVEINGELRGSIAKLYQEPDEDQNPHCEKCSGERRNAPILGMTILYGLHQDEDGDWSGGEILDPGTGQTYRSKLSVSADGKSVVMRGYIGISVFGRSQTWQRAD